MTTLPSLYDSTGAQFAWDATSLKMASTCQRYYYYSMIECWEGSRSVHLIFGGHYASALELYHKLVAGGSSHDEAVFGTVRQTLINSWIHSRTADGERVPGTGHVELFDSAAKSRESLIRTIIWYLEEFKSSDYTTALLSNGKAAVELSFKIELSSEIIYAGHLDRLLDYGSDKFVQDQKTTGGALGSYYFDQYATDIQMSGYTFGGRVMFNMPIKGVMIDAAQIGPDYTRFMRGFTFRSEGTLNEWHHEMLRLIADVRRNTQAWRETGDVSHFPMNFTACGNYGGCSFRNVCSMVPSMRQRFLESNYNRREQWNPLVER
jgi:hypothetical protein